eukprot:1746137-Rhodomonas_salina.1
MLYTRLDSVLSRNTGSQYSCSFTLHRNRANSVLGVAFRARARQDQPRFQYKLYCARGFVRLISASLTRARVS